MLDVADWRRACDGGDAVGHSSGACGVGGGLVEELVLPNGRVELSRLWENKKLRRLM